MVIHAKGRRGDRPATVVLVVDDEPDVRHMAMAALSMAGFKAQFAEDGAEGLECFLKHRHEICLVVAETAMARMSGLEMVDRILEIAPNTKVLMMSRFTTGVLVGQAQSRFPFIRKPLLSPDFIRKIHEVLALGPSNPASV